MVKRITPDLKPRLYLQEWRTTREMSQETLAELADTTKATISRWETGERDPPYAALCKLAEVLRIHVSSLFFPPSLPRIDSELAALPKHVSRRLIQDFAAQIKGAKMAGTVGDDD